MKRLLLSLTITFLSILSANAQSCTPGTNFADSTYGVWPDTTTNFPAASVGVPYSTDLNFKVPEVVTAEIAGDDEQAQAVIGSPIESFEVTNVDGLPAGINYACNISSCSYNGGANGCANLFGTTNTPGVYPVTITVTGTIIITVGFIDFPVPQELSFDGYKIVVGLAGTIEEIIQPLTVVPNPASESISVKGLNAFETNQVEIINLEGKVVSQKDLFNESNIDFDLTSLRSGVYFLRVGHTNGNEIVRFIKK